MLWYSIELITGVYYGIRTHHQVDYDIIEISNRMYIFALPIGFSFFVQIDIQYMSELDH